MKTNLKPSYTLLVEESWINATRSYRCGESGIYAPYTDNLAKLFKGYQRDYGKCVSKVYQDDLSGISHHVGWCFEKLQEYTDTHEKYLQETWVLFYQGLERDNKGFYTSNPKYDNIEPLYIGEATQEQALISRALSFA